MKRHIEEQTFFGASRTCLIILLMSFILKLLEVYFFQTQEQAMDIIRIGIWLSTEPTLQHLIGGATNIVTGIWTEGRGLHKSELVTCEKILDFQHVLGHGDLKILFFSLKILKTEVFLKIFSQGG